MKSLFVAFVAIGLSQLALGEQFNCDENSLTINVENFENSDQFLVWGNEVNGQVGTTVRVVLNKPTFSGWFKSPFIANWNLDDYNVRFLRRVVDLEYNNLYNFGALLKKKSTNSDAEVTAIRYKRPGDASFSTCTLV
mmetsp:Transcript_44388/g.108983  ORF Transcript_44388/g.108983 Transcript_44388/m.108983 type:complete len:137 (+) Transcript_44388:734-1144(+)|eukprot:CAMPEP_0198316904 /NCGR_PEP_ID=MMETSP1450-20131203/6614_1 /TAXON_ID=753684 ORGANISM="Madagascaria erythrocladiodes, Strain CCMP3234" /NCGR_SAMPLE_ID=MMETSP1450 /ASSEMBLY_ACC=CAM_ASM_001115 /LENGTH=136 /DNA_ID=CAMNT_0044020083 /DNA_START=654 /DNA_END=1064 /DNA_ORIENTATION=-